MRAAVLTEINGPLDVAEVELTPLKFGQVLVKVLLSGICGAQLQEIRGEKGNAKFLPHLMGHEGAGEVIAIGEGVTKVKHGDKVVMHWRKGAGIESPFPEYIYNGKRIQSGRVTTFAEQSICSENRLTKVDAATPEVLCALLGCGLSTALATIETEAEMKMGESLLIIGCGGLGLNLIRAARMRNVYPIHVCDKITAKAAIAIAAGATTFSDEVTCSSDVVIDTAGDPVTMSKALQRLKPGGRYIMLGQPKPMAIVEMLNACHMFEGNGKSIKATQGGGFMPDLDIPRYVSLAKAGLLDTTGIVSDTVSLTDINRGISLVRDGKAGRVMVATQE